MNFTYLPTLADVQRTKRACAKGPTRLQEKQAQTKTTLVDERTFKQRVWTRDRNRCRCCGRKVIKTLALTPERGDVHHCHGRGKDLRFEDRAALLLCAHCHQRVTGKVNDRLTIIPTKTFEIQGTRYTDARHPVTFRRVA